MTLQEAFRLAVANVAAFGDTDVFPSTLDRFPCQDTPDAVVAILEDVHRSFDQYLANVPPENIDTLVPLGYTAFRWATQIDPLWNLYYLSLVLLIAESIESKRLPSGYPFLIGQSFRIALSRTLLLAIFSAIQRGDITSNVPWKNLTTIPLS